MKQAVSVRWRALGFVALSVACVATATGYVVHTKGRHRASVQGAAVAVPAASSTAAVAAQPHLLLRNLSSAAEAGFAALAPLTAPDGPRHITGYPCLRLHMAAGQGLCLAEDMDDPFGAPYRARIFGPDFTTSKELPLAGLPSRARVSPDGRLGASTVFVNGDSYAAVGAFSTRTTIYDMAAGAALGDLESFEVYQDGKRIQRVDFNFWGVTFARSGRFYATLGTAGHTYLVEGDVATRRVEVLRDGVECPSLSPDGTRIAFKQKVAGGALSEVKWRLSVLSLDTLTDHLLAETRSVDDQAEWLDGGSVLYSVESDTWTVPADGSGPPRLFARRAESPAVIR